MISVTVTNAHPKTRLQHAPVVHSVEVTLRGNRVRTAEISVILVSDEELLGMNREFLNHDYYTDVITFPLEEKPLEGEIYISVDRAREQAAEHGVGVYHEVRRLAIHGTLHLLGYDDATPEERETMRTQENRFLER